MEELTIDKVKSFLTKNEYSIDWIKLPWRHIVAKVNKDGCDYFFKIAAKKEVSQKTENEYNWTQKYSTYINSKTTIKTPRMYQCGNIDEYFYFFRDFIEGKLLATPEEPTQTKDLEKSLGEIANLATFIINIPVQKQNPALKESIAKKLVEKATNWSTKTTQDTTKLLDIINKNINKQLFSPLHGDFVPWHFLTNPQNKIFLFDNEAGSEYGAKYYDIAYFYHRTYTKLKRPDIADTFLKLCNKDDKITKDYDWFLTVLSQRTIGGAMDAETDNITDKNLQQELSERIINNKIL